MLRMETGGVSERSLDIPHAMLDILRRFAAHRSTGLLAAVLLCGSGAAVAQSTVVRVATNMGNIDVQLLDVEAPKTVANFLSYVRSNAWVDVIVHRNVPGFVIQTGGYRWPATATGPAKVPASPPVVNEFSASRSNLRGTLAMAKLKDLPDSATSEWFVNLADNISPCPPLNPGKPNELAGLDCQNGGFTVFARVSTEGMVTADKIAGLTTRNAGSPFDAIPVINLTGNTIQRVNTVLINAVTEFPAQAGKTDSDRIFDFLEKRYPLYVPVEGKESGAALGYVFRYYPKTNSYVGTKDNQVWYLVPEISPDVQRLGTLTDWLVIAATSGT